MSKKKKLRIVVLSSIAFVFCICLFFLNLIFNRSLVLVHPPTEEKNTLWECEECDFYFLVAEDGYAYGEVELNGNSIYTWIYWDIKGNCAALPFLSVEKGYLLSNEYSSQEIIQQSDYTCKRGVATITVEPRDFYLWETDEPVTLTFVCQGHIPEVDIYNGVDPIRRMEVID